MTKNNDIKYFVYLRKSTDSEDRQVCSIEDQRRDIENLIKREKLNIVEIFEESASAHKIGRLFFNEMMERIQNNEAGGILCWHLNRIARNALDGAMVIHCLDTGLLKEIKTPSGTTTNTGSEKFSLQIEFAMSKKYSDDLSDVVKRGVKNKFFERNQWICLAKQGYINIRDEITNESKIKVDEERFKLLRAAGELIISGKNTAGEVFRILNKEWGYRTRQRKNSGGNEMAKSTFYNFLSDSYYYGLMRANIDGKPSESFGDHKPMFTKKEWDIIQIRLGKNINRNYSKHNLPYRGIIKCDECSSSIVSQEKWQIICPECKTKFHKSKGKRICSNCKIAIAEMKDPKILHYVYYGCTKKKKKPDGTKCSQKHIRLVDLEKQILSYLEDIQIDDDFKDWAIDHLSEVHKQESSHQETIITNLNQQLENCKIKLNNLLKLKISVNSSLSDEEYETQRKFLFQERDDLMAQIEANNEDQEDYLELTKQTFDFARYSKYWFQKGSTEEKTQILQSLGYNLRLKDKKILIDQTNPFFFFSRMNEKIEEIKEKIEPRKKIDIKKKPLHLEEVSSIWSGKQDSNLRPHRPKRRTLAN